MKRFISIAFGAAALATVAFAAPAEARSNVGVYIGPGGIGVQVGHYNKCRDYWYRRNHPYRCGYRNYHRERYVYPNYYYNNDYRYRRHYKHDRHNHHRRHHNRWDRH